MDSLQNKTVDAKDDWYLKCEKVVEVDIDAVVVATGHYSQQQRSSVKKNKSKKESLWVQWIHQNRSFWEYIPKHEDSPLIKQIIALRDEILAAEHSVERALQRMNQWAPNGELQSRLAYDYCRPRSAKLAWPKLVWHSSITLRHSFIFVTGPVRSSSDKGQAARIHRGSILPLVFWVFPFFESRGKWNAQLLSGKRTLPTCHAMMQSIEEFYHSREITGFPKCRTRDIGTFELRCSFSNNYADHAGFPNLEEWKIEVIKAAMGNFYTSMDTYRDSYDHDLELLQVAYQSPYFT
ncbi:hypothetical protein Acr_16g0001650 [Actinidia rufa]|uniref:Flavin-containing monooxygenase n=1 Tax=Actinidia rufa TaxID=165716 RepID=A0A7J0FXW8_9ERIC|nr:hypothetical protein Acr_16g0001650 [Actinidia rufa]